MGIIMYACFSPLFTLAFSKPCVVARATSMSHGTKATAYSLTLSHAVITHFREGGGINRTILEAILRKIHFRFFLPCVIVEKQIEEIHRLAEMSDDFG